MKILSIENLILKKIPQFSFNGKEIYVFTNNLQKGYPSLNLL